MAENFKQMNKISGDMESVRAALHERDYTLKDERKKGAETKEYEALKNFNFSKLIVIDPKPIFPNDKILATSVGAKNLIDKASLIPKIKLERTVNVIGKNTKTAVRAGFYHGYTGLIENIIKKKFSLCWRWFYL